MAIILKQSTASQEILLGPFLDDTDGKTAETGLTIANTDIKIWKAGGTSEASKNSGGATHIASGRYYAVLDATDTDTLGSMEINVHVSGALPVRRECIVLAANVYDALIAGTDLLQVDVSQFGNVAGTFSGGRPEVNTTHAAGTAWGSGAITAASIAADAITAAKIADGAIDAATFAAGAITAAAIASDAITDAKVASDVTIASVTGAVGSVTGNVTGSVGSIATGGISAASFAAGAIDSAAIAANAIGASELAADAVAEIADAVWDEALSGHLSAGSTGEALNAAGAAGDPWTTALPGAYSAGQAGYIVGTNLNATVSSRASQSSVDTIDGIVDSILLDTAEIGAAGAGLTALASASNLATLAGYVDTEVAAILAAVDTEVAAIKAKTDNLPASPAATGDIPTAVQNADALLNRDMSAVSDTNSRSPLNALRHIRNKWSVSGTTLTVTKEDDTTSAWTSTLTTNASADPITGSDPA
ncbi:MAG: hypothetical protein RJA36_162 [Pseudomonadota bacterium]|jgi:hypothetical protein